MKFPFGPLSIDSTAVVRSGDVAALVQRNAEAISAWIRGEIRRYLALITHADDFTLMTPFGGETRGHDWSEERIADVERYFRGGEAHVELLQAHASGALVVLVTIERQHGEVGGLPAQDWSLRVTAVYRWEGEEWRLVHRHADPLVKRIDLAQLSALAR